MNTQRQNKVSRLIQKEIGDIFQKEGRNIYGNLLVTVTQVRISPDLGVAKTYVSIFPSEKTEETIKLIRENSRAIRHDLSQRTRHQLRKVPELIFYIDDSLDYTENIENLLK